jgi:hypothetical protein
MSILTNQEAVLRGFNCVFYKIFMQLESLVSEVPDFFSGGGIPAFLFHDEIEILKGNNC